MIFANPQSKPPARIECWLLRLQQYDFKVMNTPGEGNPADFMSRYSPATKERTHNIAKEYAHFITSTTVTVQKIGRAIGTDEALIALQDAPES